MALLATFSNAGIYSIVNAPQTNAGTFCIAHGLTTTPDFALFIHRGLASVPIALVSRTATTIICRTGGAAGGSVDAETEMFAQVIHSIQR